MIDGCEQYDDLLIRIGSLDVVPGPPSGVSLVIQRSVSSSSSGGKKTACGTCGHVHRVLYDHKIRWIRDLSCGDTRVYLEVPIRRVRCRSCRKVKREQLARLADNPLYTTLFAFSVGRRCAS